MPPIHCDHLRRWVACTCNDAGAMLQDGRCVRGAARPSHHINAVRFIFINYQAATLPERHTSRTPVDQCYYASLVTAGWPTDKVIFWALLSTMLSSHM